MKRIPGRPVGGSSAQRAIESGARTGDLIDDRGLAAGILPKDSVPIWRHLPPVIPNEFLSDQRDG